ncbi:MAG: valine--tRNA ligase [Candidatus Kapaibacterium sp.]|nr:MAG: valine--tRNA ligase [Candidatus Kapabacteria bacterium]
MELPKAYNPSETEQKWYEYWLKNRFFASSDVSEKPPYSILMPPPNVTGILHFGHILNHTIQDIYIRWHRMRGYESCWFPGTDHAGIATESKVVQQIKKEGLTRQDLGREKFTERVWEWKEQYGGIIFEQLKRLGNSSDWDRMLFTMDESSQNAVREVFVRLFDEGLVYRGKRIINWSPLAQSALSDEEVQWREVKEFMYTLRYTFEGDDTIELKRVLKDIVQNEDGTETTTERTVLERVNYLAVATARPETLFGDVAVAVNPKDERYKHLIGKRVRVPLAGQFVPIIADDYAEADFGTGCVKITPAHDPNDFMVGDRHSLERINTMNPDGTLNELTGEFNGMERFKARKAIMDKLKELDLVEEIKDYTHNVGYSERGGEPIEPYLSDQWFVQMKPLAAPALASVKNGDVKFYPEHWVKTYEHWMTGIKDWCISRQLWWGIRIPAFYAEDGRVAAARSESEARQKLGLSNDAPLRQDDDVFDTWFSSNIWAMTTMGWDGSDASHSTPTALKFSPTNLLVTGPDIIFFWVARMIMFNLKFKGVIPFKDVYFTSIIRDAKGRKLSKSLGNSPDPLLLMDKYGADAMRFTMINAAPIGTDVKLDINDKTQDIASLELGRNFANKVWNAARFLMMKREEAYNDLDPMQRSLSSFILQPSSLTLSDLWIQARFHQTIKDSQAALEGYKLNEYAQIMYRFIWSDFCDWYVEAVKIRLYASSDKNYNRALVNFAVSLFDGVLRLLHPIMPFVTEQIWQAITSRAEGESVCVAPVPEFSVELASEQVVERFARVQSLTESIRALRGLMNVPPHENLPVVVSCPDAASHEIYASEERVIQAMTKASTLEIAVNAAKPDGAVSAVVQGAELFVVVKGVIDPAKERERLQKEIARLENLVKTTAAKLANEKFVANAALELVEYEKQKLTSAQDSILKIQANIAELA